MPLNEEGLIAALAELQDAADGLAARAAVDAQRMAGAAGAIPQQEIDAKREEAALWVHLSRALGHLTRPSQTP